MNKRALYVVAILFAFAGCNKKSSTYTPPQSYGHGGYSVGGITGLFDIILPRNCDTTIMMPIKVYATIYGNWNPYLTISFGPLPTNITSVVPATYGAITSVSHNFITDTVAFHIYAVDSGYFPVTVLASSGRSPSESSDSFKIIVH